MAIPIEQEPDAFREMSTLDLVAYWNILVLGARCFQVTDDLDRLERHQRFVSAELGTRGILCESGRFLRRLH